MNLAELISVVGLSICVLLILLLVFARRPRIATVLLACAIGMLAFGNLSRLLFLNESAAGPFAGVLAIPLHLLLGPVLFCFTRASLYRTSWPEIWRGLRWWFLPPLFLFVYMIAAASLLPELRVLARPPVPPGLLRTHFTVFILLFPIWTLLWMLFALRIVAGARRDAQQTQSVDGHEDRLWLRTFVWATLVWSLLVAGMVLFDALIEPIATFPVTPFEGIPTLLCAYLVFFQLVKRPGYFLVESQGDARSVEATDRNETEKYARRSLSPELRADIVARLSEALDEDQVYLEENISLNQLANRLNTPPHQLSMVINQDFQSNFFGLINLRRVDAARELLGDPDMDSQNILEIAFRSGFNSKASFNRAFKDITGQTPTAFRKSRSQNLRERN